MLKSPKLFQKLKYSYLIQSFRNLLNLKVENNLKSADECALCNGGVRVLLAGK